MKIGIIGLPNVGKSTLFKALTQVSVDINNYPFCTIEPNIGIVKVPDERLNKLTIMSHSAKSLPAVVKFVDIAGLVKGASAGEGLGNKFLAHIREVEAIVQVVRAFKNDKIIHVNNQVSPKDDIEIVNTELILADLETVAKAKIRLEKEAKKNDKKAIAQLKILALIQETLADGKLAHTLVKNTLTEKDKPDQNVNKLDFSDENTSSLVRELSLLTLKPFLYVYNISESMTDNSPDLSWLKKIKNKNYINLDIKMEEELAEMTKEEMQELKLKSNLNQLILKAYQILGLITFFTTGPDETRAWTIKKESLAPQAGATIHTDFKEKFIRAEVIHWDKLLEIGSWTQARELGKLRIEGKNYIVQDGDVIEFKI